MPLTHLTPQEFLGTAFWIGFTVELVAAEAWIQCTRGKLASPSEASYAATMHPTANSSAL